MAMNDIDQARAFLRGVATGDPDLATRHVGAFLDVFRFQDGFIAEHRVVSAEAAPPPNKSGHTQAAGSIASQNAELTEA